MFVATKENLTYHLRNDLGLKRNDMVFMHSGIIGLGRLENGEETITQSFSEILSEGILIVPSFTYSWCKGEPFDQLNSECSKEMGGYAQNVWKEKRFTRSSNPNFSVAALKNKVNKKIIEEIFDTSHSCFGEKSVFDNMYKLAKEMDGYIILLGGAHNDAIFRTTFIHYVEEKVGVPNRYLKKFYNPKNKNEYVEQLVRFLSKEEYKSVTGKENSRYNFPIVPDYSRLGEDLIKNDLIVRKPFGYSETRMVNIKSFCDFLQGELIKYPDYCV